MLTQSLPLLKDVSRSVLKAAEFCRENYDYCFAWSDDMLQGWLQWHANRGLLGIYMLHGKIEAVATVRVLNDPSERFDDYYHDPCGDIVYVSMFASTSKRANTSMLRLLLQKFYQSRIAFSRNLRTYHEYNMIEFVNRFRKVSNG